MSERTSVRVFRLNQWGVGQAEIHARRLDEKSKKRVVRDVPPVVWLPDGVSGDGLSYPELLANHVKDVFVPKGEAVALHILLKFPETVPVGTLDDDEAALKLAVDFAHEVFGPDSVVAARKDRDERSFINADVILAPRYMKVTKHTSKPAVSLSKHMKDNAVRYGLTVTGRDSLANQGKAMQDAWADFLKGRGFEAVRGKPKTRKGPDWVDAEIAGLLEEAKKERAAAAQLLEEAQAMAAAEAERLRKAERYRGLAKVVAEKAAAKKAEADQKAIEAKMKEADDRISAAKDLEVQAAGVLAEVVKEREAISALRDHLRGLELEVEKLLKPVRNMVAAWRRALPLERAAMGPAAVEAVKIVESDELAVLAELSKRISGANR